MRSTKDLMNEAARFDSFLDVGCGLGSALNTIPARVRVGVDIFRPALKKAKELYDYASAVSPGDRSKPEVGKRLHYKIIPRWVWYPPCWMGFVQADIRQLGAVFAPKSFDCVYCTDVLEHLGKETGYRALRDFEAVARKCILLFLPIGQHEQVGDPWKMGNDYYNTHRSEWYAEDLSRRGYEVWYYRDWFREHHPAPSSFAGAFCMKRLGDPRWTGGVIHELTRFTSGGRN